MTSLELINRTIGPSQTEGMVERHRGRQWISGETEGLKKKKGKKTQKRSPTRGSREIQPAGKKVNG